MNTGNTKYFSEMFILSKQSCHLKLSMSIQLTCGCWSSERYFGQHLLSKGQTLEFEYRYKLSIQKFSSNIYLSNKYFYLQFYKKMPYVKSFSFSSLTFWSLDYVACKGPNNSLRSSERLLFSLPFAINCLVPKIDPVFPRLCKLCITLLRVATIGISDTRPRMIALNLSQVI